MATSGFSKSRNLLARKRLQERSAKRTEARRVFLEALESRQLLAVGPQLLGVQPSTGDLLENGEVLDVSPRELVFRFDSTAGIDPTSLDGIRIIRSGTDGVFERASAATDFGTGGQTLVGFFAAEAGESGNGIQIQFSAAPNSNSRAPIVSVSGRTVNVVLNSNPLLQTRVEDILQAFDQTNPSQATSLVYALRLRGSQTIEVGNSGARLLTLAGANAAETSTDFGLGNNIDVRFVARDTGNDGLGIVINVTARDRGGAGNPIVSVDGKTINVEINSNARFPTTIQEFVDALNANDSASSSLIEARLVSGVGATRLGTAPITYSPIALSGVSDIEVQPAYIGLGDTDREVIVRFAEALPDDNYRIEILGQGTRTLRNVNGEVFNCAESASIAFTLDLGAQIESVVPQPVRNTGTELVQERNKIDVYFNDDDLIDVRSIASVNGILLADLRNLRTPLFFDSTDTIVFNNGAAGNLSVLDASFYKLFHTADTLDNTDDTVIPPSAVRYYPATDRVTLSFDRNLDELTAPGTGARLSQSDLRLRVGTNEVAPLPPVDINATIDPADTFADATSLPGWTPGAGGSQSVLINSIIDNPTPFLLDFPGGSDEPGNRTNRYQDNLRLTADSLDGTSVLFYNFQNDLGVFSNSNLVNAITEQQKERVREVLSIYERYLGIRFVESASLGMTIAVGDTRAIIPFEDVIGSGVPGVVELNGPGGTYYEAGSLISNGQPATVLDIQDFSNSTQSEFAGPFQRAAMQAIGRLLGLGLNDEGGALTIQSFDSAFAPGVGTEIILPGDADIVHGKFLYRPDSKDVDLYQFSLPVSGRISIETFAERMSQASLLDSQIRLYQQDDAGGWTEIAANDDYYSSDSYLELDLAQGNYIVGVSASGNAEYDPTVGDSGLGGRSEGDYQLRMNFRPPAQSVLRDGTGTAFDGDADGAPDGVFNFWFRARPESRDLNVSAVGSAALEGQIVSITSTNGVVRRFELTSDGLFGSGNIPVGFNIGDSEAAIATSLAAAITAQSDLSATANGALVSVVGERSTAQTVGSAIEVLGKTLFVDKQLGSLSGNGTLASPFRNIDDAISLAQSGDVVRIVGNAGADGDMATQVDNLAYEIGFDNLGRPLPDGATLDVPQNVAVVIDAGAILKMRRSRVGVGSTSVNVDRSAGSLMVLGTPVLLDATGAPVLDAAGEPASGDVYFTSVNDAAIGVNANPNVVGSTPARGDWGGLDFRSRIDTSFEARRNPELEGQFLNWVSHADLRYGGGQVVVDGVSQTVTPVQMVDSRPTVAYSTITNSASAAMTATPNSFLETNFDSPAEQGGASFTVDYDRVGPDLDGNTLTDNSINALQVRVRTPAGTQLEKLTVQGRFDDTDVVHYIPENLEIEGTPGGSVLINEGPSSSLVVLNEQVGGTLPFGQFNYRFTTVDINGVESTASEASSTIFTTGAGSVILTNLPVGVNRIYRSSPTGDGPYDLIAEVPGNTTSFVDTGANLGTQLADNLERFGSRLDARLAIDAGTIVKLQGSRIDTDVGAQLIAEGQDGLPVVFTSLRDASYGAGGTFDTANQQNAVSAQAGDWGGLYVGHTSKASLDHVVVAYGGGTTRIEGGFSDFNAIEVHQGDLRLANSRVVDNANGASTSTDPERGGRGTNDIGALFIRGAQPIVVENIFLNNQGPALSANVSSLNSEEVLDWGRSTGRSDRFEESVTNRGPLVENNRLTGNEFNAIVVRGGELTTEGRWDDTDIVHVVLDEIRIPDHQHFSGLRLASSADQSLVIKLEGADAGFTASGTPLDNANRIGGSVQLLGQPNFPVILTSLSDDTVGAGFGLDGNVQNETTDTAGRDLLPTIGEVNNGTLIDNDVPQNIPGYFGFDVGAGGSSGFFQGQGGITAQGNTQLFINLDVVFEFLNYIDVGANGGALDLSNTTITTPPTLIAPDLVISEGNFPGENGQVDWRVETTMPSGETTVFNKLFLSGAGGTALGDLQVINYLDEDIQGVSDDILTTVGTPGQSDFRAFTLDGPERIGFSQGGIYAPTVGDLENATYEGWAADEFNELQNAITGAGTTYTVAGNIDQTSLPLSTDPDLGDIYGPEDVTTAFAWRVDPNSSEAIVTSFLELVPRNPATAASSGDWRSVLFETFSNDRNVGIVSETESTLTSSPLANENPSQAQFLGSLAPNEKAGDENLRLGFQVEGVISRPSDVDVYSFRADAGTEVWFDIDDTKNALDTVVELVDANGRTLALSDDSFAEEADPSLLFMAPELGAQSVNPLRASAPEFYFESATGAPKDLYSTNPKDAGLRVRLPGEPGSNNLYHVRVRSSNLNAGDPASQLLDQTRVADGLTKGTYQLQLRLQEVDEVPGSTVNYADVRFATNGLQIVGIPGNSPLLGENGEVEIDANGTQNDTFANAQALGNLLQTNRQAISVAGNLDDLTDVDWFSFDLQYANITPTVLREYFATVIDVDYADGIGRPDTSIYVFDAAGNLILGGLSSSIVDDQSSPVDGAGNSDLSRGSAGSLDPFIGAYELPAGRYFLAVTNSQMVPAVLATYTDPNFPDPNMRLQPIEGVQLIAEDHVGFTGGSTAEPPITPILFAQDAILDYTLSDVALYVSQDVGTELTNIYIVNPFTGETRNTVGRGGFDVQDIDFRPNGELRAFDRVIESQVGGNVDRDTLSDYINIDSGTAQFTVTGNLGLNTSHLEFAQDGTPTVVDSDDGINVEAITFGILGGQERGFAIGNRPTPPGFDPVYDVGTRFINNNGQPGFDRPGPTYFSNIIYEFDENTGTATSAPANDKTGLNVVSGAGTAIRDRGFIDTFTRDGAGNIITRSSELLAREVTRASANGGPVFVISDGDTFVVEDGLGFQTVFEFDLGPEVIVNYDPANGIFVRDGDQFSLDGTTYEFDTGNIIVVNASNGSQLQDGSTVRIQNTGGNELIFEYDLNGQVVGAGNIGVPYSATSSQAELVAALADAINAQTNFGVIAQFNPNSNRLSLVNASQTQQIQLTGNGLSLDGTLGVTPGATRIPISEASSLREFVTAVSTNVTGGVVVSFDSGRMNFSGATDGIFTDLTNSGVFTNVGSDGNVGGGNIPIRVLASDTAETVAIRIANAVNGSGIPGMSATASDDQIQLIGVVIANQGPLAQLGIAPGGIITGAAIVNGTMFAVSDEGGLYSVFTPTTGFGNVGNYISSSHDLIGIRFSGLVEGPAHVQNGALSQLLFGVAEDGTIHAFNTAGELQPVFANGASSISTGLVGANGLTLSSLDFNLWHRSGNRSGDPGHGLPSTPNDSRNGTTGGTSFYFGFQSPGANGVGDLSGPNATGLANSYNFPGGAAGVLESQSFSLAGVNAADLPTLYFNYFLATEDANSDRALGSTADDFARDNLRVYASGPDGQWVLLSTNNDPPRGGSNSGTIDDEFDPFLTGNENVQPLFDNTGNWRQARVPLDVFAGQDDVRLRFEFSTHGGFGYGLQGGKGPEIRTVEGSRLADGEALVINGQQFELETGPIVLLPAGSSVTAGDFITIEGVRYVFTDGSLPVNAPDIAVNYTAQFSSDQMAAALRDAVANNVPTIPTVLGQLYDNETNDILTSAEFTGITGDTVQVIGSGEIGDNPALVDLGEDVDMVRIDVDRGAIITATVEAAAIGSTLDSFLRVFDSEGRAVLNNFGQAIENDNFQGSSDSQISFIAPESGTYYIAVSGAGNSNYSPTVLGNATTGSTGTYNLVLTVERQLTPFLASNRVQLEGARNVILPLNSPFEVQGALGTGGVPVQVNLEMTAAEVATALQQSLADFFAGGITSAYPTRGDVLDLTGLVDYSGFDFLTGLPAPTAFDLDPGPFGATTSFVGDAFGAFNRSTTFTGGTNNQFPGALGAQNNDFEGVYVDDFIIGIAGRGEQVLESTSGDTSFVVDPQLQVTNPATGNAEILQGPYQFEIRGGAEYGIPTITGIVLDSSVSPFDRMAPGLSIQFNGAANIIAGSTFTVGDGTTTLTFEMDDVNDGIPPQPGNIAVPYSASVLNPANGARFAESAEVIAGRVRDIINSPAIQAQLDVSANLSNNDRTGSTIDTVVLFGNANAVVPSSIGQTIVSGGSGGANRERPQGQLVINATTISNSQSFGITIDSAARDPLTGATVPSSPRNTVTINEERLAPGAVIMNSEFMFNNAGGVSINGDPQVAGVPAAVPFVRMVNNTIVGGVISTVDNPIPTIEGGQVFDNGILSFADAVTSYSPTAGGGPTPVAGLNDPAQALGAPNYTGTGEPQAGEGVVSLGRGGQIVLEFTNNFLTGSGDANPDLMVFEVGDSEEVLVEVSADGANFTSVGRASAASPTIDIDPFGFSLISRLKFVRLTDVAAQGAQTGESVGADIDAIGAISSVPADLATPGGDGITVTNNATATLLNNVIVNTVNGINVDVTSASTIIGGTVYQGNVSNVTGSADLGQFPTVLENNVPIFVDPALGNLYPAQSSPIIDSSIDSLEDRTSIVAVKEPLGIPASPILAPEFDIRGQLRVDDPAVETPSGLGENVFKDRGAQDRADFIGPSVVLQNPLDNDNGGADQNAELSIVELTNATLRFFDIQILDGLEPSDPSRGTGVDNRTVSSSSVLLFRNNQPLVEGIDYQFGYDSTNGVIRLQPLAGLWQSESAYTIRFVNSGESGFVATNASAYTDGDQFTIIDAANSVTTFEIDLGFLVTIPTVDGVNANITDGTTFVVDDGVQNITFEMDTNGLFLPENAVVNLGANPTVTSAAIAIQSALTNAGINAVVGVTLDGLQITGSRGLQFNAGTSGLGVTGQPGVQTVFGLQIPLLQGQPNGVTDGQVFTIDRSGAPVNFEFDTNGSVLPGNVPVFITANSTADQIGAAMVAAIDGAALGLSPAYDGGGLVRLGGDANTGLDLTATVLTQTGVPGQPAAVPIVLPVGAGSTEVAGLVRSAIEAQALSGISITQFGNRLVIEGVVGVSGVGANLVGPIRDLAGNPLKPNQIDGSTTLTIFLGEGLDYGDAGFAANGVKYASEANENGPRHTVVAGLNLGASVTTDADAKLIDADEDDGLTFGPNLYAAFQGDANISVTNTTGSAAFVSMWIDFDSDGFFEAAEQVIASQAFGAGTTGVSFTVPSSAVVGSTVARVRLSTDANAVDLPIGAAADGEVEDHVVTILGNPYSNTGGTVFTENGASFYLDVNADGFVSPIDALQVVNDLNTIGPRALPHPDNVQPGDVPQPGSAPFLDVNGDGFISSIDALAVINYLNNQRRGSGEGEAGPAQSLLAGTTQGDMVFGGDWLSSVGQHPERNEEVNSNDVALLEDNKSSIDFADESTQESGSAADIAWSTYADDADDDKEDSLVDDLADDLLA